MKGAKKVFRIIYKSLAVLLMLYGLVRGLTTPVLYFKDLQHTIRNLFFHVPLWYVMIILMFASAYFSIRYLRKPLLEYDMKARVTASVGVLFSIFGLLTGILWSRVTWGAGKASDNFEAWWMWDPKQTFALIMSLIYLAYFVLRRAFDDPHQKARVAGVYNLFAAAMIIPMYILIPNLMIGNHPGSKDEGIMSNLSTLDNGLRAILYPYFIGTLLLSIWVCELQIRLGKTREKIENMITEAGR